MWIRQCIHLNVKAVLIIVVTVVMNGVLNSSTAQNSMHQNSKPEQTKNNTNHNNEIVTIVNVSVRVRSIQCDAPTQHPPTNVYVLQQQQHHPIDFSMCPPGLACSQQPAACIVCTFNHSCVYGRELQVSCEARKPVACLVSSPAQRSEWSGHNLNVATRLLLVQGVREFQRSMLCRYCWQTELWEHSCTPKDNCNSAQQQYM